MVINNNSKIQDIENIWLPLAKVGAYYYARRDDTLMLSEKMLMDMSQFNDGTIQPIINFEHDGISKESRLGIVLERRYDAEKKELQARLSLNNDGLEVIQQKRALYPSIEFANVLTAAGELTGRICLTGVALTATPVVNDIKQIPYTLSSGERTKDVYYSLSKNVLFEANIKENQMTDEEIKKVLGGLTDESKTLLVELSNVADEDETAKVAIIEKLSNSLKGKENKAEETKDKDKKEVTGLEKLTAFLLGGTKTSTKTSNATKDAEALAKMKVELEMHNTVVKLSKANESLREDFDRLEFTTVLSQQRSDGVIIPANMEEGLFQQYKTNKKGTLELLSNLDKISVSRKTNGAEFNKKIEEEVDKKIVEAADTWLNKNQVD